LKKVKAYSKLLYNLNCLKRRKKIVTSSKLIESRWLVQTDNEDL